MVWKRQVAEWKGKWVCWRFKNVGIKSSPSHVRVPISSVWGLLGRGASLCMCMCVCV